MRPHLPTNQTTSIEDDDHDLPCPEPLHDPQDWREIGIVTASFHLRVIGHQHIEHVPEDETQAREELIERYA